MSSQGMTQAQLEARRRELERQQEESRRKKVKQQTSALAQAYRKAAANTRCKRNCGMGSRRNP